jgi:hypothetical protein
LAAIPQIAAVLEGNGGDSVLTESLNIYLWGDKLRRPENYICNMQGSIL